MHYFNLRGIEKEVVFLNDVDCSGTGTCIVAGRGIDGLMIGDKVFSLEEIDDIQRVIKFFLLHECLPSEPFTDPNRDGKNAKQLDLDAQGVTAAIRSFSMGHEHSKSSGDKYFDEAYSKTMEILIETMGEPQSRMNVEVGESVALSTVHGLVKIEELKGGGGLRVFGATLSNEGLDLVRGMLEYYGRVGDLSSYIELMKNADKTRERLKVSP